VARKRTLNKNQPNKYMAALWNSSSIPYGTDVLTVGATAYIPENVSVDQNSTVIQQRDENNEPSGSVGIADFASGSATLQLSTGGAPPAIGDEATVCGVTMYVSKVSAIHSQGDARKCTVEFVEKIA
tara:strand:+ start:1228 stop:1608 length:381 start_codon:yes stop_codon:yes gene_type:complete